VDKNEIAALLDAICERPQDDSGAGISAELQALCIQAAKLLSERNQAGCGPDSAADSEQLTAALAIVLSGSDAEAARRTVQEAASRSSAMRLDVESALAFVDAIERSPQTAPAYLVEEVFATGRAGAAPRRAPERDSGLARARSRFTGISWSSARWRTAAACVMLLIAGAGSWSAYWQWSNWDSGIGAAPPSLETSAEQPALADAPRSARAAPVSNESCDPGKITDQAANGENAPSAAATKAEPSPGNDCAMDHQVADRPGPSEANAMRQRAEAARKAAARKAAAAREAAEAAGKRGTAPVESFGSMFGASDQIPAAAARSRPPAAAPPALTPATR
jgi:hypothetical protein